MADKILIHPNGKIPLILDKNSFVLKPRYINLYDITQWILVDGFWDDDNFWVDSAKWIDEL